MDELIILLLNKLSQSTVFSQPFTFASCSPSTSYYYESFQLISKQAFEFLFFLHDFQNFGRPIAVNLVKSIFLQYCSIIKSNLTGAHFKNQSLSQLFFIVTFNYSVVSLIHDLPFNHFLFHELFFLVYSFLYFLQIFFHFSQ